MKRIKKLLAVFLFFALVLGYSLPVQATPVDDLKTSMQKIGIPEDQMGNIVEYLQKSKVSDSKYNEISNKINDTTTLLGGKRDITSLDPKVEETVLKNIADAFSVLGLSATFSNGAEGNIILNVKDSKNSKIFSMDSLTVDSILTNFDINELKNVITLAQKVSNNSDDNTFDPVDGVGMKPTGTSYGNLMVVGLALVALSTICFAINKRIQKC